MASAQPKKSMNVLRKIQRYGWIPDMPDHRDLLYAAPVAALRALPPKADLRASARLSTTRVNWVVARRMPLPQPYSSMK